MEEYINIFISFCRGVELDFTSNVGCPALATGTSRCLGWQIVCGDRRLSVYSVGKWLMLLAVLLILEMPRVNLGSQLGPPTSPVHTNLSLCLCLALVQPLPMVTILRFRRGRGHSYSIFIFSKILNSEISVWISSAVLPSVSGTSSGLANLRINRQVHYYNLYKLYM